MARKTTFYFIKSWKSTLILCLFFIGLPYLFLAISLPIGRDSGVFMYTGRAINTGFLPYIDSWDHKGPLIYLFNALGLLLGADGTGVIVLEGLLLFISMAISMRIWKTLYGNKVTNLSIILFATYYFSTFEGGNLSETWFVPFCLISYSMILELVSGKYEFNHRKNLIYFIFIGITLGIGVTTRLNNGFGLFLFSMYVILCCKKNYKKYCLSILIGFSAIIVPILIYLNTNNLLRPMFDQYIKYNIFYVQENGLIEKLTVVYKQLQFYSFTAIGILLLFLMGVTLLNDKLMKKSKNEINSFIFLIPILIDIIAQSSSGRIYGHYLCSLSPVLITFSVKLMGNLLPDVKTQNNLKRAISLGLFLVLIVTSLAPARNFINLIQNGTRNSGALMNQINSVIQENSQTTDPILIFGSYTGALFSSNRISASAFTYNFAPQQKFQDSSKIYTDSVIALKPKIILEVPDSCGISRECDAKYFNFKEVQNWIFSNYDLIQKISGFNFWVLKN